ncbi:MAG: response regulator, partial [Elusimicrobiota bacterium]
MIFGKKKHILLVDDDDDFREPAARLLEDFNYRVATAATGAETLTELENDSFDLVILDIDLPDISGMNILKAIRSKKKTKNLKVLMLSAMGKMGVVDKGFNYGADDYMIKPVDVDKLKLKISKLI